jgi:hypothetical protein
VKGRAVHTVGEPDAVQLLGRLSTVVFFNFIVKEILDLYEPGVTV